jgi:hypothetical protein
VFSGRCLLGKLELSDLRIAPPAIVDLPRSTLDGTMSSLLVGLFRESLPLPKEPRGRGCGISLSSLESPRRGAYDEGILGSGGGGVVR